MTVFLPLIGLESIDAEAAIQLLEEEKVVWWRSGANKSAGLGRIDDARGQPLLSVNFVVGADGEPARLDSVPFAPYASPPEIRVHSDISSDSQVELRYVKERDIDLLFIEELASSQDFREWFAARTAVPPSAVLRRVSHSVLEGGHGETDIAVSFEHGGRHLLLLVENKLDAVFQPRQPERYHARARDYLSRSDAHEVRTVLLAPESYGGGGEFDVIVRLEEIHAWFTRLSSADPRVAFKLRVLEGGIRRAKDGWQPIPDRWATDFWDMYWRIAEEVASELRMPKPGKKPATSGFVRFRPFDLPKGTSLIHKFPYGVVDLQFSNAASRISSFAGRYQATLSPGMSLQLAGKSIAVRIHLNEIALGERIDSAATTVRTALSAAKALVAWHRSTIDTDAAT